jgi:hypothetical protein
LRELQKLNLPYQLDGAFAAGARCSADDMGLAKRSRPSASELLAREAELQSTDHQPASVVAVAK